MSKRDPDSLGPRTPTSITGVGRPERALSGYFEDEYARPTRHTRSTIPTPEDHRRAWYAWYYAIMGWDRY